MCSYLLRRFRITALTGATLLSSSAAFSQSSRPALLPATTARDVTTDEPGKTSISLMGGQFIYDRGDDKPHPYVTARLGRSLSRFFEGELSVGYSRINSTLYSFAPTFQSYNAHTSFFAADVAIHAMLPLGRFAPYAGVSAGLFHRPSSKAYDNLEIGGSSIGLLAGARIRLNQRFGIRGEFRYRSDMHDGAFNRSADAEQSLGVYYRP